jgi:hypothetical protein
MPGIAYSKLALVAGTPNPDISTPGSERSPTEGGRMADDPTPDPKATDPKPPEPDPKPDPKPDDDPIKPEDDWQAKARKHERDLKKERKAREDAETALREREDADKTEQQKAIDKARAEGKKEALTEAQKERRADQLEVAVTRLATKGIQIGDATQTFADSEDALVYMERSISRGDIDPDDIFDSEGKVKTDVLTAALGELLQRKPQLAATDDEGRRPSPGDGGARTPVPPKDLDEQIREAEEKGDVRTSIALNAQKLRNVRAQQEAAR